MSKTIENYRLYNSWDEWIRLIYGNADHGTVEPKENDYSYFNILILITSIKIEVIIDYGIHIS